MVHQHAGAHPHARADAGSAAGEHQVGLLVVLALTLAYVAAEVLGGIFTHSLALVADAGHMLTDALGIAMAVAAIRLAHRPATAKRTYGFYRAEILAALVNGVLLVGVAAYILLEAVQRFRHPATIEAVPMLVVACGGLVVTAISARVLHGGSAESLTVRGAFLEVVSDFVGAVGTIVAAVVVLVTGWTYADPLISVGIALFILPRAGGLLRGVVDVLLEAVPPSLNVPEIAAALRQVPGVQSAHDLHIWTITSGFVAMSGHILAAGRPPHDVLHDCQQILRERFGIQHATLQVEVAEHVADGACCAIDPRCLPTAAPEPPSRTAPRS